MIYLAPYNPDWPTLFTEEAAQLQTTLGKNIVAQIEHIGSTAIPGIAAKPIIDIMLGVHDLDLFTTDHIKQLETLGYHYRADFEAELPNRRFFQKTNSAGERTHHIHLVNYHSAWWQRHLLFRDYLQKYPTHAKTYENHKLALAKQFDDTLAYSIAKTTYCQAINKSAYFDFTINKPFATTNRLYGYLPQESCFEIFCEMFHDPEFIDSYGVTLSHEYLNRVLKRDSDYWDHYQFAPLVWFDKTTNEFVGEGGLNHSTVENQPEIELTYSLKKEVWGKGLATEISQWALHYAFKTLKLNSLVCFTMPTNKRSLRVMRKLGFSYEKDFIHANLPHKLYRLSTAQS